MNQKAHYEIWLHNADGTSDMMHDVTNYEAAEVLRMKTSADNHGRMVELRMAVRLSETWNYELPELHKWAHLPPTEYQKKRAELWSKRFNKVQERLGDGGWRIEDECHPDTDEHRAGCVSCMHAHDCRLADGE